MGMVYHAVQMAIIRMGIGTTTAAMDIHRITEQQVGIA